MTATQLSGLDVYIIPFSLNGWLRSYRRLYDSYDYVSYGQTIKVRHPEYNGNPVFRQPHEVDNLFFINTKLPDEIMERTVGKYVLKNSNHYSNEVFSVPYESDIGYLYDYCETGKTCGNCMGNTSDESDICLVDPTAFDSDSNVSPLTDAANYGSVDANWNSRNKLQNHTIPIALCAGLGIFVLIMFIVYVGMMGSFTAKVKENKFMDHDFTEEQMTIKKSTKALGALSGLVFAGTIAWAIYSIIEGKKSAGKRFFPATNYNRSVYNPPPGYTFVNAPSQTN
jgi:hypothetical protein